jgi:hypothetical protein
MSKYNALLKKIEVFEKLAVYGDRRSFLKAIAQAGPTSYDGDIADQAKEDAKAAEAQKKTLLYQAQRLLQGAGAESSAIGNALLPLSGKPADMNAILSDINNALMTGKLSPLSNEYKQLKAIYGQLQAMRPAAPKDPGAGEPPMMMPADRITGYAPISKQQQQAVFQFVLDEKLDQEGKILPGGTIDPKFIDGRVGKQTRSALEAVKNYFAQHYPNNPRMSDQQAMTAAMTPANKNSRMA